jgi:hypothetical protein
MRTRTPQARKLVGYAVLALAGAIGAASCREERAAHQKGPAVTVREPHVVSPTTEEITHGGELTGIMVERPPAKPEARRPIARREPVAPVPPVIEPPPPSEQPVPDVTPVVPERPVPRPPSEARFRFEAPETPERSNAGAIGAALGVGIAGLAAGATAAGAGDGTTGDRVVTTAFLGVGLAGLAAAGILYAAEPAKQAKPVNVTFGPGMLGVRGTF